MDLIRARYLLYPVFFLLILFLLDKIFLLPEVRDGFIQPGGMLYYRQRELQIGRLHEHLKKKPRGERVALVFGDSRSFAIGDLVVRYIGIKNWTVFNFTGPQAVPAYHAYLAGRIFNGPRAPDYLLLGLSPDTLNRNAGIFATPVLNYGVDASFIEANRAHIPERDYESHVSSRRYALAGLGFKFNTLFKRLRGSLRRAEDSGAVPLEFLAFLPRKNGAPHLSKKLKLLIPLLQKAAEPNLSHYSLKHSPQVYLLNRALGAQYVFFGVADDETLRRDSKRLADLYLKNFVVSPEQMYFLGETLRRARLAGVRTVVFWPRVNPHLLKEYERLPVIRGAWRNVEALACREGALAVDLNRVPETTCGQFYDASHMSFGCFPRITRYLVRRLKEGTRR